VEMEEEELKGLYLFAAESTASKSFFFVISAHSVISAVNKCKGRSKNV